MILTENSPVSSTTPTKSENGRETCPESSVPLKTFPVLPSPPLPTPETSVRICPPCLAVALGTSDHAIVLSQIHYWMKNPHAGYLKRGRKWVWFSYNTLQLQLPWLSVQQIGRIIRDLERWGFLFSTNKFNTTTYNRTKWYSVHYEAIWNHFGYDPWEPEVISPQTLENSVANIPSFKNERQNKYYPQTQPQQTNNSNVAFLNHVQEEESGTSTGIISDELKPECCTEKERVDVPACMEVEIVSDADGDSSKPVERNVVDAVAEPPPKPKFEFPKLKKREKVEPEARSNGEKEEIDRVLDDAGLASPKLKAFALKYSLDEVQKALAMLRKQGDVVQNAAGWLTNCLKGRWWKSHQRQKATPAKSWEAELAPWYAWAISEGIVEDVPVRHLAADYRGEPIVRLAQPDRLTRAPYTSEPWRKAMEQFPMPSGMGRGDGETGGRGERSQSPNVGLVEDSETGKLGDGEKIPNSEFRIPNSQEKLFSSPPLQDASLGDEDNCLRERPVKNDDRLPSGESSDFSPGGVSREVSPEQSPALQSHIAQNNPSESVTNKELSDSPPDETSPENVSRKVALDFHDPDWMTFPWEPKNGWSPGANRERLLRQKAEWGRGQLLRVSSDEELHALFEKLGDCALSCLEWLERHLLTPQDIASRHARIEARRNYQQQLLFDRHSGFPPGAEPMG